ncbi:MAG: HAMP domain-containing protein, partial [Nitrospirae bacterium]|nr:HAMP domain-containing protein [Nitrospirota bacterium]
MLKIEDIEEVRVFNPSNSTIVASSVPQEIGNRIYNEDILKYKSQTKPEVFSRKRGQKLVYSMLVPIYNDRPCQRCHGRDHKIRGVLDVEISTTKTVSKIKAIRIRMVVFSLLTFLTLGGALTVVTNILVTRPVEAMIKTMKKVEEGDLSVRVDEQRGDEIGRLAASFNSMVKELQRAHEEIQRCHLEEMKRVERMANLGELAAAVAHEIKNPLAGISGAIQVIAEELRDDDSKKEIVSDILSEIERLDKTVRDLLTFAKPISPTKVPVEISSVIERSVGLARVKAEKQDIRIIVKPSSDATVRVDPEQIAQVLLNIMLNAIHSMPEGGTITIKHYKEDDALIIDIKDSGHGIPPEKIQNIFKPFYTTKHTGTGLGLSISKNIVEEHGGEISAFSEPGI